MAVASDCTVPLLSRRRKFWTTQPNACGEYTDCGDQCGIPGLQYINEPNNKRSIVNDYWVRSLVLNILNTRARRVKSVSAACPRVADSGGHWSESFREDGLYIGTRIWDEMNTPVARIQDAVSLLAAQLRADIGKLVQLNIASDIEVDVQYKGSNRVSATITINGPTLGENTVNLTSERLANEWVWR